ncbi:MAG: hypothetical protein K2X11_15590 [Acetobacteraceae bacterium]|nr:hypothetical protein [Acetobacteraceae bacterium]
MPNDASPPGLIAYDIGHGWPGIRPASPRRAWMDATPDGFANRCLPLSIANAHGWEIPCEADVEVEWNGGARAEDLRVRRLSEGGALPVSHFGSGVLTFHVNVLFRTPPGISLWVGGSPNEPKDGIAPLTGIVETDWAPMTFTMNWKLTRPGLPVRFARGEAFCFVFPIGRRSVMDVAPELRRIAEDPDTQRAHAAWAEGRARFNAALTDPGSEARAAGWQREYHHGRTPEAEAGDHLTRLRVRPFRQAEPPA